MACWAMLLVLVPNKACWGCCHWAWILLNGAGFCQHTFLFMPRWDTSQWNFCPLFLYDVEIGVFSNIHCILLPNIYLWFQVGFLMWLEYFLFFFSNKELPGRSSIPRPYPDCLKRGQKPSIVQLVIQALALVKGQCHSPQKGKGSAPWIDRFLFPPH